MFESGGDKFATVKSFVLLMRIKCESLKKIDGCINCPAWNFIIYVLIKTICLSRIKKMRVDNVAIEER